jgi:hypothetical protein
MLNDVAYDVSATLYGVFSHAPIYYSYVHFGFISGFMFMVMSSSIFVIIISSFLRSLFRGLFFVLKKEIWRL